MLDICEVLARVEVSEVLVQAVEIMESPPLMTSSHGWEAYKVQRLMEGMEKKVDVYGKTVWVLLWGL